jgi:hypothetical protein
VKGGTYRLSEGLVEQGEDMLSSTVCWQSDVSTFRRWHALHLVDEDALEAADEILRGAIRAGRESSRQAVFNGFALARLYLATGERPLAREVFVEAATEATRMRLWRALRVSLTKLGPMLSG